MDFMSCVFSQYSTNIVLKELSSLDNGSDVSWLLFVTIAVLPVLC